MGLFDVDPKNLNQESEDADNKKMWLNVANSAANNILSAPSASEIMLNQKRAPVNVGLDRVAAGISDPWEKQKKTYEAYKTAKEGQALEADNDPNSKSNMALDALLVSKYKADPAKLQGLTKSQKMELFGNPGKLAEIEAQSNVDFKKQAEIAKLNHLYSSKERALDRQNDLDKVVLQKELEQQKKVDPNQRLQSLSGADKARLDNALMVLKGIDDMGAALDKGDNTFSVVGDNDFTRAKRNATEAYGRMQSGGAINKDEEERFDKASPGLSDAKRMQRQKLLKQREEMISRLKTLGFTPEDVGYAPKEFAYGGTPEELNKNKNFAPDVVNYARNHNISLDAAQMIKDKRTGKTMVGGQ